MSDPYDARDSSYTYSYSPEGVRTLSIRVYDHEGNLLTDDQMQVFVGGVRPPTDN
jgi:hypothetical protein